MSGRALTLPGLFSIRRGRSDAGFVTASAGGLRTWATFWQTLSGSLVVALLVLAPLHFGSTRRDGIEWLWLGAALAGLSWCAGLLAERRIPRPPVAILIPLALFLIALTPWLAGLMGRTEATAFTRSHFATVAARWPQSLVWWTQENQIGFFAALALMMLVVIDLARNPRWVWAFVIALTSTGTAVAGLALVQNLRHWRTMFGEAGEPLMTYFSGTFYHHTSAGAFLNLIWPLAFSLGWLHWRAGWRMGWNFSTLAWTALSAVATVTLGAAHAAHVSRLPQVVAVLAFLLLVMLLFRRYSVRMRNWSRRRLIGVTVGTLALLATTAFLISTAGRVEKILSRWQALFTPPDSHLPVWHSPPESQWADFVGPDLIIHAASRERTFGLRQIAYEDALTAIAERPWFGHGPANWQGAASRHSTDPKVRSFFQMLQFTHQDVLQTTVEWGILGTLGWWGLLAGGLLRLGYLRATGRHLGAVEYGMAFGLGCVLLQSQWDFPLQMAGLLLPVAVLSALCWSTPRLAPQEPGTDVPSAVTFAPFVLRRPHG